MDAVEHCRGRRNNIGCCLKISLFKNEDGVFQFFHRICCVSFFDFREKEEGTKRIDCLFCYVKLIISEVVVKRGGVIGKTNNIKKLFFFSFSFFFNRLLNSHLPEKGQFPMVGKNCLNPG